VLIAVAALGCAGMALAADDSSEVNVRAKMAKAADDSSEVNVRAKMAKAADDTASANGPARSAEEVPPTALGRSPKGPPVSLFRCWQEGRVIFEGRGYGALPSTQIVAELKASDGGAGRVQILDMYQGLCVLELPK